MMSKKFSQFQQVRVKRLLYKSSEYNDLLINQQEPKAGDIGTIVDILKANDIPDGYLVENVDPETGLTIWLCIFSNKEIEPV